MIHKGPSPQVCNNRAGCVTISLMAHAAPFDFEQIALALTLAMRGEGRVEPNPMVGCVLAKRGRIIGKGYHRRFGGPHAEIEALRSCQESPKGATVYCTLEPCSHFGKTPPCVDALIEARVARVVIPILDPNPQVHGRGVRKLRRAGIKVEIGVMAAEASELVRPFATRTLLHRPYVIAKWAQSANGLLVPGPGESRWISGPQSLGRVHLLRARVDAIMVGAGTVLKDDPLLTARDVSAQRVALRVVVDGRLRIPLSSQLVQTADRFPTVVFTTATAAKSRKAAKLCRAGVEVIPSPAKGSGLDPRKLLASEALAGVTNLLVEGGPRLLNSFFRAVLVDEAQVYISPRTLGGSSAGKTVSLHGILPDVIRSQQVGRDVLYTLLYAADRA